MAIQVIIIKLGLSEDMYVNGFTNIINVDFSPTIVNYMNEINRSKSLPCNYKEINLLDMSEFQSGEFNVVIDKGTLDSVLCAENALPDVYKMMREIYRVLTPTGVYICITYGNEEIRKTLFVRSDLYSKN